MSDELFDNADKPIKLTKGKSTKKKVKKETYDEMINRLIEQSNSEDIKNKI